MPDIIPLDLPASYWRGKAQQAKRAGNLREAARLYRAALVKSGENAVRRELAEVYADMRCLRASDRLYLENLAWDARDADSLYGLARNRSMAGDENAMADLLDLYLRLAPCGDMADQARDILWRMPRQERTPCRLHRAEARYHQAADVQEQPLRSLRLARHSWRRGHTADGARLLSQLYLRLGKKKAALRYALTACRMAPRDLIAREYLAAALRMNDMPRGCRAALREAAGLCASLEQVPAFCAFALSLGQGEVAISFAEEKLRENPDCAELMELLGTMLRLWPEQEERSRQLLQEAQALDADSPIPRFLLSEAEGDAPEAQLARQAARIMRALSADTPEEMKAELRKELLTALRLPVPALMDAAANLMISTRDAVGLRLLLVMAEMPPVVQGMILHCLGEMGEPLPCFVRAEGRLVLAPSRPRPPYDTDLQDLIHTLLRTLPAGVTLDQVAREVPPLWRALPMSARRHCAQSRDDVWPGAFAAYLILRASGAGAAAASVRQRKNPKRVNRALKQLIRRSKKPYEMYRF